MGNFSQLIISCNERLLENGIRGGFDSLLLGTWTFVNQLININNKILLSIDMINIILYTLYKIYLNDFKIVNTSYLSSRYIFYIIIYYVRV